jgi:hypothetical protein
MNRNTGNSEASEAYLAVRKALATLKREAKVTQRHQTAESIRAQEAAWKQIHAALCDGVASMNRIAMKRPDLFKFAGEACYWPVIKSPGIGFQNDEPTESDLFATLSVGDSSPLSVSGSKWNPKDRAGKLAVVLWQQVANGRLFPHPLDCDDPEEKHNAALSFRHRAAKLPPFSEGDAWLHWWEFAKEILAAMRQDPTTASSLDKLISAPSKRGSQGRLAAHLETMLKGRFASMAGVKHRPGR